MDRTAKEPLDTQPFHFPPGDPDCPICAGKGIMVTFTNAWGEQTFDQCKCTLNAEPSLDGDGPRPLAVCPVCNGLGERENAPAAGLTADWEAALPEVCPRCSGSGQVPG